MKKSEKTLAGCLVGVLAVFIGYKVVNAMIVEPRRELQNAIAAASARLERRRQRHAKHDQIVRQWTTFTARTLGRDYKVAQDRFREDIAVLLDRNKLTEQRTIAAYKERREKKGPARGFVELPISVHVIGKLSDLVNFLHDLYQRPYLVRVDKLGVQAELKKKRTHAGKSHARNSNTDPRLNITMTLTTLVLPAIEGVPHPTFDLADLRNPEKAEKLLASARRLSADPETYSQITKINPFRIWEPPPPKRIAKHTPKRSEPKPKHTPPKPRPRRDADKWVLVGTASDGQPVAYVANEDDLSAPLKEYRLNAKVDDGTLVLIVPEGIVVRVHQRVGRRKTTRDYFYALGKSFKDRVEVRPDKHPEIHRMLRVALSRSSKADVGKPK